jgi:hypothetical protein
MALWLLAMAFTLTKGGLAGFLGSESFTPDMLTTTTAYIFLRYGLAGSCIFALGQGLFVDLLSGGMYGIFTFLYLSVFGGILLCSRFFNLHSPRGQAAIVCLVILIKYVFFSLILKTFSQYAIFSGSFLWDSLTIVLVTGLITPLCFYLFDRLKAIKLYLLN